MSQSLRRTIADLEQRVQPPERVSFSHRNVALKWVPARWVAGAMLLVTSLIIGMSISGYRVMTPREAAAVDELDRILPPWRQHLGVTGNAQILASHAAAVSFVRRLLTTPIAGEDSKVVDDLLRRTEPASGERRLVWLTAMSTWTASLGDEHRDQAIGHILSIVRAMHDPQARTALETFVALEPLHRLLLGDDARRLKSCINLVERLDPTKDMEVQLKDRLHQEWLESRRVQLLIQVQRKQLRSAYDQYQRELGGIRDATASLNRCINPIRQRLGIR